MSLEERKVYLGMLALSIIIGAWMAPLSAVIAFLALGLIIRHTKILG